jgi:hypothetical protein
MKRLIATLALVGVITIGAGVSIVYRHSGQSDTEKAAAAASASFDRLAVSSNQLDLSTAAVKELEQGGTGAEYTITKRLLLCLREMPESYRREQIDHALDTLKYSSCYSCTEALESARP